MPQRLAVVLSQGQSLHPAKRKLEEEIVAELIGVAGLDVTVVPHLYDLAPDGTGMLCLQGIAGDFVLLSWLYPRAAHWILDRHGIRGQVGAVVLNAGDGADEADESAALDEAENEGLRGEGDGDDGDGAGGEVPPVKKRVVDDKPPPNRRIYCLDLRVHDAAEPFIQEVRRIAAERATDTMSLGHWPTSLPAAEAPAAQRVLPPATPAAAGRDGNGHASAAAPTATRIDESPSRRWYPVIDYSRCTNCMECIDFCLFGVYGVDGAETILVEQPDNCRKGCPACSRVCPENAIIFPQHKTPVIAGSPEIGGPLKIDLSLLFGGGDGRGALETAAAERDEQLVLAGRAAVGMTVGIPKRQSHTPCGPKDDLDKLIDALEELQL